MRTESATLVAFGREIPIHSAVLDGLRIGPVQSARVPAGVGDLSYLEGAQIDAIVGIDVLVRTNSAIDYRSHTLTFAPVAPEQFVTPMQVSWPFLTVRMTFAGHGDKTVRYESGPARLRRLDLHDVRLGTREWRKLPAWTLDREPDRYPPEIGGILGVLALGCDRVRFDFERNEFGCSPPTM